MKVFVSSVRRGLEDERDALPPLIAALGHEPIRFEDFTAVGVPSRAACLAGVEAADAYLLLLGERYGEPLPETGLSPTEEEYTVAKRRGIPVLAFVKRDVVPEERQAAFVTRIEDYATGVFRAAFTTTADLLTQAAAGIRQLAVTPPALTYRPIDDPRPVQWRGLERKGWGTNATTLELHAVAMPQAHLSATVLEAMPARIARTGRELGFFTEGQALDMECSFDTAVAAATHGRDVPLAGIRVSSTGAVCVWQEMPSDMLGVVLDETDVARRVAPVLRLAATLLPAGGDAGLAIGLFSLWNVTEGAVSDLGRRSSASMNPGGAEAAIVEVRDAVSVAVLASASDEVSRELAKRLLQAFRSTTRR